MSQQLNDTVGGLLERIAHQYPEHDALVYPDRGLRFSYREFDAETDRVAKGLLRLGIAKGEHLAIWATTTSRTNSITSCASPMPPPCSW